MRLPAATDLNQTAPRSPPFSGFDGNYDTMDVIKSGIALPPFRIVTEDIEMRFRWMFLCVSLMATQESRACESALAPTVELNVQSSAIALSLDSKLLAVADDGGLTVKLLNPTDGRSIDECGRVPVPVTALAFSPDGKLLAAAGVSGTRPGSLELRVWRLEDKKVVYEVSEPNHRDDGDGADAIAFLRFSPNSKLLVHPAKKRTVIIYDLEQQKTAHSFPWGLITSVVIFDSEGKTIAVGTDTMKSHGGIHRIDLANNKGLPSRALLYSGVLDMAFSPDGTTLFGGHRGWLYRLDTKTGNYTNALKDNGHWVATALAFSPQADRAALLTGKHLQIWDTNSGTMLCQLPLPDGRLTWSTDGRTLVTATVDGMVRVWDVK